MYSADYVRFSFLRSGIFLQILLFRPKIAPFAIPSSRFYGKRRNFRVSKVERLWQDFLRFPIAFNAGAHPPHFVPFRIGIDYVYDIAHCSSFLLFGKIRCRLSLSVTPFLHCKGKCCISYYKFRLCSLKKSPPLWGSIQATFRAKTCL